jgi:hypothetical protein
MGFCPGSEHDGIARSIAMNDGNKGDNRRRCNERDDDPLLKPVEDAVQHGPSLEFRVGAQIIFLQLFVDGARSVRIAAAGIGFGSQYDGVKPEAA